MIVHQEWTDQLSDYLDGELSTDERAAVDQHLRDCPECAAVLNDLKRVVARAASAPARPPAADLWTGIAARIEPGTTSASASTSSQVMPFARAQTRRFAFTVSQLAAAAALLIAISGGVAWQLASRSVGRAGQQAQIVASSPAEAPQETGTGAADFGRVETVSMADAQYDAAVSDLETALKAGRGRLDASTIAIVEHNLQIIDQAINQAREALAADPANSYLSGHLVEARRRKLDLLRRATALATETD
jgi:anti-sigma factor RsiW